MRVPHMEGHSRPQLPGQLHLDPADLPLGFPGAQVIVVVQADLPDGPGLPGPDPSGQPVQVSLPVSLRLMGMNAHGADRVPVALHVFHAGRGGSHVGSDHRVPGHAVLRHPGQYLFPVLVELLLVHMAVAVKQGPHPTIAPSSTPSPTVISRRFPALSSAERIMPWLSMPAIFRGARLVMATICFPIRSSGW